MSFDALTVAGVLSAVLAGGFFLGLQRHNDRGSRAPRDRATGADRR